MTEPETIRSALIVSTSWIGDAIMGMPALQLFRGENPGARITMLAKPGVKALWRMHPAVDSVEVMGKPLATARRLRPGKHDCAYVLPNSLRSAFVPWAAGIPRRVGMRGHFRRWLLSEVVPAPEGHQQHEYKEILGVGGELPRPEIEVPEEASGTVAAMLAGSSGFRGDMPLVVLLPGAARGPSKRWPPDHFVELARMLRTALGAFVVLGGGPDDAVACDEIGEQAGDGVVSLAGKTSIPEWAALLKMSKCVVSNDSGGMHLSTAVGTPVVGIYGVTDPGKTGPLGKSVVIQKSSTRHRDIARTSEEAARALSAIAPAEVLEAVRSLRP